MTGSGCRRLTSLTAELAEQVRLVHRAIGEACVALLGARGVTAAHAQAAVRTLAGLCHEIEQDGSTVAARNQMGTAQDVRATVLGAHVGTAVEDLAEVVRQLVELAWQRRHRLPLSPQLRTPLQKMSQIVLQMLADTAQALEWGDTAVPGSASADLRAVRRYRDLLYEALVSPKVSADAVDAVDATLLGCRFERCADLAASIVDHLAWASASEAHDEA
jgi:phosphate uptake regulator